MTAPQFNFDLPKGHKYQTVKNVNQDKLAGSKSILAKLLARENLTVTHTPSRTAFFVPETRVLNLPIWEGITPAVYDLMAGHEVGHALYTPNGSFAAAAMAMANKLIAKMPRAKIIHKTFLQNVCAGYINVVEDVRIEKMIQATYPGLKRRFTEGYIELYHRNFFGVSSKAEIARLKFVDRINVFFKMGAVATAVVFKGAEADMVKRIGATQTWDDVLAVTEDLLTSVILDYITIAERNKAAKDAMSSLEVGFDAMNAAEWTKRIRDTIESLEKNGENDADDDDEESDEPFKSGAKGLSTVNPEDETGVPAQDGIEDHVPLEREDDEKGHGEAPAAPTINITPEEMADMMADRYNFNTDTQPLIAEEMQEKNGGEAPPKQSGPGGGSGMVGAGARPKDETPDDADDLTSLDIASKTMKAFDEGFDSLSTGRMINTYVYLPEPNMKNIVDDYKVVLKQYAEFKGNNHTNYYAKYNSTLDSQKPKWKKQLDDFMATEKATVNFMYKEFELKRAADVQMRTRVTKSGSLDMKKLPFYRTKEDIFSRFETVTDGKNHGLIMIIDGSSSMSMVFNSVVQQVISLTMFCRKAQIPFEVYMFRNPIGTETGGTPGYFNHKESLAGSVFWNYNANRCEYKLDAVKLRNFVSSRMSAIEYKNGLQNLWNFSVSSSHFSGLDNFTGTPLYEALAASDGVVRAFKEMHKVQVVNYIVLSDGDGGAICAPRTAESIKSFNDAVAALPRDSKETYIDFKENVILKDNGYEVHYPQSEIGVRRYTTSGTWVAQIHNTVYPGYTTQEAVLIKRLKEKYNINALGFYVSHKPASEIRRVEDNPFFTPELKAKMKETAKKEKFFQTYGQYRNYNEYFFLSDDLFKKMGELDIESDLFKGSMPKSNNAIAKKFTSLLKKHTMSRLLLSQFIAQISKVQTATE